MKYSSFPPPTQLLLVISFKLKKRKEKRFNSFTWLKYVCSWCIKLLILAVCERSDLIDRSESKIYKITTANMTSNLLSNI